MTAARGDKVPFLSSHAHAAHPTRPVDKGISAMRPDWEIGSCVDQLADSIICLRVGDQIVRTLCLALAIERQKCTGCQAHAVHSCGFAPHNRNGAWLSTAKTCTRLIDVRKMTR